MPLSLGNRQILTNETWSERGRHCAGCDKPNTEEQFCIIPCHPAIQPKGWWLTRDWGGAKGNVGLKTQISLRQEGMVHGLLFT